MCFSRIDTQEQLKAEVASYKKASDLLMKGQIFVPIIGGVICGAALLALDLKTWIVNKIFVRTQEQARFASETYNHNNANSSGTGVRVFSALNVVACGIPGLFFLCLIGGAFIKDKCCS